MSGPRFKSASTNLKVVQGTIVSRNEAACYTPILKQDKDRLNSQIEGDNAMKRICGELFSHGHDLKEYTPPKCLCGKGDWYVKAGDILGVPFNQLGKLVGHCNDWGYYGSKHFSALCWRCNARVCSSRDCSARDFAPLGNLLIAPLGELLIA
jgi:hypothetical protein